MLPKVKREIIDSTIASLSGTDHSLLSRKIKEIKDCNPILFLVLSNISTREDWTESERNKYVLGAVHFYMFLSMQEECDEMQRDNPI